MKSGMLNRRFKKATVLVSRQTLEQAIQEGTALAETLLQTNPHDPQLDQVEQAIARLQGVLQMNPETMAQDGASSLEDYLDDAKQPGYAAEIKKDVDMIANMRQQARGGASATAEVLPVEAAGPGSVAWVNDRDESGQPKTPVSAEVPRIAAKKKEAEPAPAAVPAGPQPGAATGSPLDYIPTEMILKMVQDLPKQEGFEQNKGMQDALVQMTQILQQRPVSPVQPEAGAAPAAPAPVPVVASKNAKGEPFGGKQAPPFGKKDDAEKDEKKEDQKTSSIAWERTIKAMDQYINNPAVLANTMKAAGYTPHKAMFILRKRGAAYLVEKFADVKEFFNDGKKGEVLEDGGRTPEVAQAHGLKDEGPAKLNRPSTTPMDKFASAVKDAKSVGEKLKAMYLDAKPLLEGNATATVRNFVESIYKAYSLCDEAVKTLNKQEMQETAEEEAAKIKIENKKKSSLLGGLSLIAAE